MSYVKVLNDDVEYGWELINNYDFPENLFCDKKSPKVWLDYCRENNMKFLKGSYGTLVHKDFNKYFKVVNGRDLEEDIYLDLKRMLYDDRGCGRYNGLDTLLDHTNLLQSTKYDDVYVWTSSPYNFLKVAPLMECPFNSYLIHPNFIDYYGFIDRFNENKFKLNPFFDVNYLFTTAHSLKMHEIVREIDEGTGLYCVFTPIKISD